MFDLLLCTEGDYEDDLELTEDGDIKVEDCLAQNIRIAIRWIADEWRLGPDIGLPYYEDIWVKNPNFDLIRQDILEAILNVDGVADADVEITEFDRAKRKASVKFTYTTEDGESDSEEVSLSG